MSRVTIPTDREFQAFPKIPRLNRNIVITEKIDGTNAAIIIEADGAVYAQSRKKFIAPGKTTDNHGFAGWVEENADYLVDTLGVGAHYGEWWGSGIQSGYGLKNGEKRFSLFNSARWAHLAEDPEAKATGLGVVPVLYRGPFSETEITMALAVLSLNGSVAAPGFANPEGVIVYHEASREMFKVTIKNDEAPKTMVGAGATND